MENNSYDMAPEDLMRLPADVIGAYVSRNAVALAALPEVIRIVHVALAGLGAEPPTPPAKRKPAVPIGRSVQQDYIVCLEYGKHLKMLKRYLRTHYDLSPEEYRRRWGLSPDYPMVAPTYAARRSAFAKQLGLGRGVRRGA